MTIDDIIRHARTNGASDIHISENTGVALRIHGSLCRMDIKLSECEVRRIILSMADGGQRERIEDGEDADFAYSMPDGRRQRVNVFHHAGGIASTIRLLNDFIPTLKELGLPQTLEVLAEEPRGLVLVTGPTGSGKSTTLAAMIEHVNKTRPEHIITIEDPIEYVYSDSLALIHQRETGRDVKDFASALRSALREDPDVILVGEMRDYETVSAAVTAAETGHLVLSTLHTTGAAQTIDRIIDACPAAVQDQMRTQLAGVLKGVITQCLLPTVDGKARCAATELLLCTDAVSNMIRENKCHMLNTAMQSGAALGMHTLNSDLVRLVRTGRISRERAVAASNDRRELKELMG